MPDESDFPWHWHLLETTLTDDEERLVYAFLAWLRAPRKTLESRDALERDRVIGRLTGSK